MDAVKLPVDVTRRIAWPQNQKQGVSLSQDTCRRRAPRRKQARKQPVDPLGPAFGVHAKLGKLACSGPL